MDWLLIKNIQHLSRIQLDLETKQKLLFHFENFYKVERKAR
jgi:hypothetical protein